MAENKRNEVIINRNWCKGCSLCVSFCPKEVLVLDEEEKAFVSRLERCVGCRLCEMMCPDLAITVITEETENSGRQNEE